MLIACDMAFYAIRTVILSSEVQRDSWAGVCISVSFSLMHLHLWQTDSVCFCFSGEFRRHECIMILDMLPSPSSVCGAGILSLLLGPVGL